MPAKKPKQQPKQPKKEMTVNQNDLTDSLTVSQTDILDLNMNSYASAPSYTLGSGITSITLPSSYSSGTSASYTIDTSSYNWGTNYSAVNITSDGLTMKEGADIKIGGKSLTDAIEKIEERLGILKPNPELEDRWEQLKELRRQYMELEKDLLEKEKIMKILKEK